MPLVGKCFSVRHCIFVPKIHIAVDCFSKYGCKCFYQRPFVGSAICGYSSFTSCSNLCSQLMEEKETGLKAQQDLESGLQYYKRILINRTVPFITPHAL